MITRLSIKHMRSNPNEMAEQGSPPGEKNRAFYKLRLKSNETLLSGGAWLCPLAMLRRAAMTAVFIRLAPVASGIVNYTQILGLTCVDYGAAVILAAELINSLAVHFCTGVR